MQKKSTQSGFTLIELMVVIVILGILITIGLNALNTVINRARIADIKANMHTMQTMLEIYTDEWFGFYPNNVAELYNEATTSDSPYWKNFKNPYMATSGEGISYEDESDPKIAGMLTYDPYPPTLPTKYYLYGYEQNAVRIKVQNQDYIVSNK